LTCLPRNDGDPELRHEEHDHAVDERQSGDDGHDHQPEPDEDVDLLVDDVERLGPILGISFGHNLRKILNRGQLGKTLHISMAIFMYSF
jgi:hypothetical protein